MTVEEMLARMTSTELNAWAAYEQVAGPLGPARADIQAAVVASTVANANKGKRGRRFSLKDFIPKWDAKAVQHWAEQLSIVEQINAAFGGRDKRKGGDGGDPVQPAGQAPRRRARRRTRR